MSEKGIKKPRKSEYGKPHAVRFKNTIDKELAMLSLEKDIRPSSIIQAAVECFLKNSDCVARNKIMSDLV